MKLRIIIIIIAGIIVVLLFTIRTGGPVYNRAAYEARLSSDFRIIEDVHRMFYYDTGRWPEKIDEIMEKPEGLEGWKGPYLKEEPVDPWKNKYLFFRDPDRIVIATYGADAKPGGENDCKDYFHAFESE